MKYPDILMDLKLMPLEVEEGTVHLTVPDKAMKGLDKALARYCIVGLTEDDLLYLLCSLEVEAELISFIEDPETNLGYENALSWSVTIINNTTTGFSKIDLKSSLSNLRFWFKENVTKVLFKNITEFDSGETINI